MSLKKEMLRLLLLSALSVSTPMLFSQTNTTIITGQEGAQTNSNLFVQPGQTQKLFIDKDRRSIGNGFANSSENNLVTINVSSTPELTFTTTTPAISNFTIDDSRIVKKIEVDLTINDFFFVRDVIILTAPNGQNFTLFSATPSDTTSKGNINNVRFTSDKTKAKSPILNPISPVTGTFLPESALNNLSVSANGKWSVSVFSTINYILIDNSSVTNSGGVLTSFKVRLFVDPNSGKKQDFRF